ncbi:MAG: hypothetical protein CR982_04310 [Candidatus Cloacimonadota bacterium]|nr:MAG: hypothetical protein CR982_04310 [Candidatus Cloacimonadota bacterium]PIE78848.1 MAG: hypothetical protein CSA15_05700 [Candidatus Delongbacteria bacterium]
MKKITMICFIMACLLMFSCENKKAETKNSNDTKSKEVKSEQKEGVKWLINYDKAIELSKKEKKHIFVDFTGSDWCGWCIKLKEEVFSKKSFADYLEKNFIPLELDFPNKKKQSEEIKKQNGELAKKYEIKGFPTILILDEEGKVIAKTGYQQGGPEKYIEHIKELLKNK